MTAWFACINPFLVAQHQVRRDFAKRKKADIKMIEMRKNAHIAKLMHKHKEEFNEIKNYFSDVTHSNLDLIRQLKVVGCDYSAADLGFFCRHISHVGMR
jgi:hypothetical protein